VDEVGEVNGAGTKCGSCRPVVHEVIENTQGPCRGCFDCPRKANAA
jgi:bacterioferritin-associated ferredoxin